VTVGEAVVLVQAAAALLLVVRLVRRGGWVLLVLQGLLVVVEGERKMWVDHNSRTEQTDRQGITGSPSLPTT
jgi:hypothetical protein